MAANPARPGAPAPSPTVLDLPLMEEEARRVVGEMPYAYYAGGAEEERLLADNVAAWARWQLHPR
ncbi:MAG TPA: hypothetical protein VMB82_00705, partial [Acidimicrobiales bacterium]|nr:hypothetical protein [Acidimicrobiales bacterium]